VLVRYCHIFQGNQVSSDQYSIRRVPLRTLWIKGIRTFWQLRRQLALIWLITIASPVLLINLWQLPNSLRAVDSIYQVIDTPVPGKGPEITDLINILSPFLAELVGSAALVFLVLGCGWMSTLHIVDRYFQGFPPYPISELIRRTLSKLVLGGGFFIFGLGGILGIAGVAGFPILDLLAAMIFMIPVYQVACNASLFESIGSGLRLDYASHFKGGRFLALVQLALLSLFSSLLVIGVYELSSWIFSQWMSLSVNSIAEGTTFDPLFFTLGIVTVQHIVIASLCLAIPVIQMTMHYWLNSIPHLLKYEGTAA
jgi:hypothetical protein